MRGRVDRQQAMFVAFDIEQFVPEDEPLRAIKRWADGLLTQMSRDFDRAYSTTGRPGVPPERGSWRHENRSEVSTRALWLVACRWRRSCRPVGGRPSPRSRFAHVANPTN